MYLYINMVKILLHSLMQVIIQFEPMKKYINLEKPSDTVNSVYWTLNIYKTYYIQQKKPL